jgi:hypothetical protein
MSADLFIKAQEHETLDSLAHRMAALLAIGGIERRESSSYLGEEYYKSAALAVVVKFARADMEVWIEQPAFVDGLADLIARHLTLAGERVMRLPNAERENSRKIVYMPDEEAPHGSKERIITTDG